MTPKVQIRVTAELEEACDASNLGTDVAANCPRILRRQKSGLHENGRIEDEYDVLTGPQDQIEEDFSSFSNFSDDHAQNLRTCSRRSLGSAESSSNELEWDWQNSDPYICVQDVVEFENPSHIEESDSELVRDEEPRPPLNPVDKSINDAIARAPLRGQGLPVIETKPKADRSTDRSEITDLGDELYANLKIDDEIPPVDPLTNRRVSESSLQHRIYVERCHIQPEHKGFLPIGRQEGLIQENVVVDELTKCLSETVGPRKIQDYARQICAAPSVQTREKDKKSWKSKSYRKVFAILVLIEKAATIGKFLDEGLHDGDLPLKKVELEKPGTFELRRKKKLSQHLECFDTWSLISVINFEEWQWTMLAPYFARGGRDDVKNYTLPDQTILPFTKDSRRQDNVREIEGLEGGFGQVFKVEMHPDHHNFHDRETSDRAFAVKRLNSQKMQTFKREFDMLAKFSDDAHEHLISLLAAYNQFNTFHFIFHWADSDLLRFWNKEVPKPDVTYERVLWIAKQCAGLASGLLKIHRYESIYEPRAKSVDATLGVPETVTSTKMYGRHGDIKPANILWFRDRTNSNDQGTLKISDFGLAELHSIHTRSNLPKSGIGTSLPYRPPEYDLIDGTISRSYDIWSIGCLYLEFLAWLLGGWDLVMSFTVRRAAPGQVSSPELRENPFFELEDGGKSARVKNCVTEFIEYLHSKAACTEYLHEFLNMIEYDMLLIETSDLKAGKRIECGKLHQKLDEMYRKCKNLPGYASTPAAWKRGSVN